MTTKTVLATGAAGFIGSNFVRHILNHYPNYRIIILDALTYAGSMDNIPHDERVQFCFGNVCNAELVSKLVEQCDIVVHFAAESHVTRSIFDNLLFFQTDVLGTQAVANAVVEHKDTIERFVHISTSEVYGTAQSKIMTEEHPLLPASPYAAAKAGADRLVYSYWRTYGIPAVILRPFNNYGPYQHLEKVIPRFITSCLLNEKLTIHGDGSALRDWVYVEDTCRAIDLAVHRDGIVGEVINIGTGRCTSVKELAETIADKMDKDPTDVFSYIGDRPGQVERHTASTWRAEKLLGWSVTHSTVVDNLDNTIAWYKNNRQWWEKLLWMRSIQITDKNGRKTLH